MCVCVCGGSEEDGDEIQDKLLNKKKKDENNSKEKVDGDQWQSSIIKKNQTMKDGEGEDEK